MVTHRLICDVCEEEFFSSWKNKKTCSIECRQIRQNMQYIYKKPLIKENYLGLRFEILKRDNFTCAYCGRNPIKDEVKLVIDHITPYSKGGKTIKSNLIASCEECNLGKSDVLLSERQTKKLERSIK